MNKNIFIKILIIIIILLIIIYIGGRLMKRNNNMTFKAKILEIKEVDGVYTLLVEELGNQKYPVKYFLDINKDTKILEGAKTSNISSLKVHQEVTITSSNIIMPSEPARLAHVKKIVINKNN